MAYPSFSVRVAFDTDPLDEVPTWSDITPYVNGLSVNTGRQFELNDFQPGTLTLSLDNSLRTFDPLHATGPYYGKLRPRNRISVRASLDGGSSWYGLFDGFVDGWPQRPGAAAISDISIKATDLFVLLANIDLPSSVYALEVEADAPHAWWRMAETRGDSMADSSDNGYHGTYTDGTTRGATTNHPNRWESLTAVAFDGEHQAHVEDATARVSALPIALEYLMSDLVDGQSGFVALQGDGIPNGGWYTFSSRAAGLVQPVGGFFFVDTAIVYGQASDHAGAYHVVIKRTATVYKVYINGVDVTGAPAAGSVIASSGIAIGGHVTGSDRFEGTLADFALYDTNLTGARIAAHYAAFSAPWDGDTTGQRIDRILDLAGIPASMRDIDTGQSILGPAVLGGNVLDHCKQIAATEQGAFYFDHVQGVLRFRERHAPLTAARSTTSQATFTDDNTSGAKNYQPGLVLAYDEQTVLNEVEVATVGGATIVTDTTSRTTYGRRGRRVDTIARTAAEAQALGEWIITHYKDAIVRVNQLELDAADDNLSTTALDLRIGDRVTVEVQQQGVGAQESFECLVEGKDQRFSDGVTVWDTTLYLSPAETQHYWIWGTDDWDGTARWGY